MPNKRQRRVRRRSGGGSPYAGAPFSAVEGLPNSNGYVGAPSYAGAGSWGVNKPNPYGYDPETMAECKRTHREIHEKGMSGSRSHEDYIGGDGGGRSRKVTSY